MRWLLLLSLPCLALSVEFSGEALYWRAAQGHFDYAVVADSALSRQMRTLEPNYDWGFAARGRLLPTYGDLSFQVGGLYIRSSSRAETFATLLAIPAIPAGPIRAHLRQRYWNLDFRAATPFVCGRDGHLLWTAGARVVNIFERREVVDTVSGNFDICQTSRLRGAGPEVGVQGSFYLCRDVSLTGSLLAAAVVGQRDLINSFVVPGQIFPEKVPAATVVAPALELRLGLTYAFPCLSAEVGYQLDRYWNALTFFRGSAFFAQNRSIHPFGFAGPYASATVSF